MDFSANRQDGNAPLPFSASLSSEILEMPQSSQVLLSGGSGFIASHCIVQLLE
jgi:hypothetical protein